MKILKIPSYHVLYFRLNYISNKTYNAAGLKITTPEIEWIFRVYKGQQTNFLITCQYLFVLKVALWQHLDISIEKERSLSLIVQF